MLTMQWGEEITSLKEDLANEISEFPEDSEITIPDHIRKNNLKSKLERLNEIEKILSIDKYKIVFIGTIGQGKTTAICHLFNLIGEFNVSKKIGNKTKEVIETKELLSTGSGRTTICEVILKASEKTYIEIEPYTVDEMESLIFEFCESIANKDNPHSENQTIISKEIERAIRNITEFQIITKTITDGDKSKQERIDLAKKIFDEAQEDLRLEFLKQTALNNANLEARTKTKIEFDHQDNEKRWIKDTFNAINNVQLKEFAIPRKIYLYVSHDILSGSDLSQFDSVIDTKGLDENPIRQDLQTYIDRQDTICLFVTPFAAAPEANISELMGYHLTSKSKGFQHRFVTLVLPRKHEPEKANGGNGDWDSGIDIKKEEIQAAFINLNLDFLADNILFYDSLRYYNDDIVKRNEFFDEKDVQKDKDELIEAIAGVIQRREDTLLYEIKDIKESFERIISGDAFIKEEIKEIEKIEENIIEIKRLRDLSQRLPKFVYEGFIDEYITEYRKNYKAWNTKHAIHRNFGYYGNINIYYDARVIAEGKDENKTLKKFTKEVKKELKDILNNLTSVNESLKTLIPELVREFEVYYDDFISAVGQDIQNEVLRKLSPQSESSDFWKALISQKGRQRQKGETFTGNVCQIFTRELEAEPNLNEFFQNKAEEHWEKLVIKVLGFFGQT